MERKTGKRFVGIGGLPCAGVVLIVNFVSRKGQQAEIHVNWAAWVSLTEGMVTFDRDWVSREKPRLWWGEDQLGLEEIRRGDPGHFGLQGGYYGRGRQIHFVLPKAEVGEVDLSHGVYVAGSFNGWEEAIGEDSWKLTPGTVRGKACYSLAVAKSRLPKDNGTFKFVTGDGHWFEVPEHSPNTHVDGLGIRNYLYAAARTGRHRFFFRTPLPLNQSAGRKLYYAGPEGEEAVRMNPGVFLKSLETEAFLGARVKKGETVFHLFAPRARRVDLFLYEKAEGPYGEAVRMEFTDELVWEARVEGNRHGWFYHYNVHGAEGEEAGYFNSEFRILDPYARACCGPLGPGIVVEDGFFERTGDGFHAPFWHDLVIAEAHVRDLTARAPVELEAAERLGFDGLRRWAESEGFYLKQLGVNAVELQPLQEFDTQDPAEYGWGYMPVNWFAPASQYSQDPAGLDQVRACRELVAALHRQGLAVIVDVVYNHIGEPNYLQYLDMEYYFLLTEDGHYHNYSGCGNTLDCETPMVRRLIRDSLVHWMRAYGVDGFRFDLGELIGKETLGWLEGELKSVNPAVVIIAEPWSFRGHIARDLRETGVASWNDGYREYLRKYLTLEEDAQGLRYFLQGSWPDWSWFPAQTVNYVASHDDRCWIDKITQNGENDGTRPTADDRRRTHLMISLLMMSLGVPMVAAGDDFLKSKGGINNTYLDGERNELDYERAAEYSGTVCYYRKWIAFRLSELGKLVRLHSFPEREYYRIFRHGWLFGMIVNADWSAGGRRLLYVVNPQYDWGEARFGDEVLWGFRQIADTERWGEPFLAEPVFGMDEGVIRVPPVSCGLFVEEENGF